MKTFRQYVWGSIAIFLGVWESLAFLTNRVPTVSRTTWHLHKYGWKGRIPAIGFIAGLTRHLLFPPKD